MTPSTSHSGAPHAHHHGHDHHDHGTPDQQDGLAEVLDLDAELFAPYLTSVTARVADAAGDGGVTQVVDLGAGTGTGTFALLERFPGSRVTAVDSAPDMLARLAGSARAKGLGDRVRTLETDAGTGLAGIEGVDLVWASASLHHVDDPAAALAGVRAALRPGGLLAVAEMDGMPHFLPDGAVAERPGLEARCREALSALHAERLPHLGADWGTLLTGAGLTVEQEHTEHLELRAPLPASAGQYAHLVLSRIRDALDGRADPADLAALGTLLDGGPQDVRHRDDLVVRSTRQLWVARRPADGS
ncbi:trans-aconitate 2-methyltransferase [Streptomyces sp. NBC_00059]|uniref:class I SAM-dependent methyltransferase n=1 Tax=Streptomyces sp. NBC_00059 TaxID=2975635 RepID=UPI00225A0278|nr:class I SAM-dependent methyltransferase [Streptomyces sp. NBC_00059]MCX5413517.1 class I SAM-dependent methyltransferase [Streptomyces sp. NBC_00059]